MATGKTPCGIAIPQVFSDTTVDINLIQQFVQKAEALGYDSLWVQESIVGNVPVLEPLSLLTYAAALTSRLRLGTSVMLTVLRNPVQLAKLVASLDQLSQGRLTVGIGIGGHVPEAIFGLPSGQRVRRFVEGIQVMKALWTQPRAQVSGTFWQFQNVAMEPKPVQKPHPPIWVGGMGEKKTLRIVAEHADGWNAFPLPIPQMREKLDVLRDHCTAVGRDFDSISKQLGIRAIVREDPHEVEAELAHFAEQSGLPPERASQMAIAGTPAEVADSLLPYVDVGFDWFVLMERIPLDYDTLQLFMREVVPRLREGR